MLTLRIYFNTNHVSCVDNNKVYGTMWMDYCGWTFSSSYSPVQHYNTDIFILMNWEICTSIIVNITQTFCLFSKSDPHNLHKQI